MTVDVREVAMEVQGRAVTALVEGPVDGRPFLVAHGAGGTARTPRIAGLATRLAGHGFRVVRFNFPYAEAGRRAPDRAPILLATWRVAVGRFGGHQAVLGGASMGGRYASLLLADPDPPPAAACVLFGYPLHPAGRPESLRVEHLGRVSCPLLFVAGTRDSLARLDLLEDAVAGLSNASIHVIAGADHSFKVKGRPDADVWDEMAAEAARFAAP